ncbi:hypothetical protein [Altibacter sp. HG106]|uniref:hypothetical protein n=1 Tax=Altibacter sp. HG106 TaxID=3023937 RepID=UPI002350E1B9|nr:hypothetical protein [Altibacter sp. HG106]MDC7996058.1 hypothetical protein [Altibacter sp. HG106]
MPYAFIFIGVCALLLFGSTSCESPQNKTAEVTTIKPLQKKTYHSSHYPKKKEAPFSDVVEVGDTYYLSGQIGMDHNTRTLVSGV